MGICFFDCLSQGFEKLNPICQWHIGDTSSKTGVLQYCNESLASHAKHMRRDSKHDIRYASGMLGQPVQKLAGYNTASSSGMLFGVLLGVANVGDDLIMRYNTLNTYSMLD